MMPLKKSDVNPFTSDEIVRSLFKGGPKDGMVESWPINNSMVIQFVEQKFEPDKKLTFEELANEKLMVYTRTRRREFRFMGFSRISDLLTSGYKIFIDHLGKDEKELAEIIVKMSQKGKK